jgi:hypothetical protein
MPQPAGAAPAADEGEGAEVTGHIGNEWYATHI